MNINEYVFNDISIRSAVDLGNGEGLHVITGPHYKSFITYTKNDVIAMAVFFKLTADDIKDKE